MPVYLNRAAYRTQEPRADKDDAEFQTQPIEESYSPEGLRHRNEIVVPTALRDGHWNGKFSCARARES